MKRKFKIRYHLGRGENYMKWRDQEGNSMDKTQHEFAYINNKKILIE